MKTLRFISYLGTGLSSDKNKDAGDECKNSEQQWRQHETRELGQADENQVNREQQHAYVFSKVHAGSILRSGTPDNLKSKRDAMPVSWHTPLRKCWLLQSF